jgi:hypothetical protein
VLPAATLQEIVIEVPCSSPLQYPSAKMHKDSVP